MAVYLNIPLHLPLRNTIRQPINRRSIATSTSLLPAKATEGAGAVLVLRPQCCTAAAAVVSHERFRTITTNTAAVLLLRTPIGTVAVVTTAVLRRGQRDITAGAAAATAGWKLQYISSGAMTRFRATENGGKRTTEIPFILVAPALSRKYDTVSSVACLLHSSMVAAIRGSRRPWWYVMTGAAAARRLSNWHRFIVVIAVSVVIVGITAVGFIATAIAIRACRDTIATAASRGSGEGGSRGDGGGYRGGKNVSVRSRLVSNAVTHPVAVLATGAADPFESRRCPADPGHVALSPAPFTVGHQAVGRERRFLLRPPSGVGTAVKCPPETKIRRQRFWRRTGLLLLLLAVEVMVASTARPELPYSTCTSTRSTTALPRSSTPSTGGLERSTSKKRVWVGRHPRCRPLFELTHFVGGTGGADNMLHVSAPKKRRVEPGALLDLVVIGKIADEDVNDLLLGFVDIDRSQAGKQLDHPGKKRLGSSSP